MVPQYAGNTFFFQLVWYFGGCDSPEASGESVVLSCTNNESDEVNCEDVAELAAKESLCLQALLVG